MCRTEREVQLARLLEFAPEQENGLGCWGGGWEWELDVLLNAFSWMIMALSDIAMLEEQLALPHNAPTASRAPDHRE